MRPPAGGRLRTLAAEHVAALGAGATLLGSGGGGAVQLGEPLLRHVLREGAVEVVAAAELRPDAQVVHVGVVGGPDVLAERLIDPRDLALATRAVVHHLRSGLDAVGIIEIGGLNAMVGVLAAVELGVPVVDGDLMGRAFPSIRKTTLAVAGYSSTPLAVVGAAHDTMVIPTASPAMAETLVAAGVAAMGGAAALALYPTTAATLDRVGVRGSLSACVALGEAYLASVSAEPRDLVTALDGRLLFEGRVDEVRPRQDGAPGSITVDDGRSTARIDYQEELLAVTLDGFTVLRPPDVIVCLDALNRTALRIDQLRIGQPLTVFSLPPLHTWPADAAGAIGPESFGLELETVP